MRNFIVKVLLFLLACVNAVDLMKVKKGKKKAPEIDIAGLGGLLGGLGGIAGGIVGGELGKTISKAGQAVQDNSAAIATGDLGNIAAAAGGSIGSLTGDDALGKTIATAGQAADGAIDAAEDDDLAGVFNSVAKGTTLIPGVGDQISTGLEAAGDITKSAKEGDTAGIVGDLGGALGKLVPGPAGGIISTLSPAAESATGSLIKGDLAGGINSGLSGIGSVIPNGQAATAIQAATQGTGDIGTAITAALKGDTDKALLNGLVSADNANKALELLKNDGAISTELESDSPPNSPGTTKILSLP